MTKENKIELQKAFSKMDWVEFSLLLDHVVRKENKTYLREKLDPITYGYLREFFRPPKEFKGTFEEGKEVGIIGGYMGAGAKRIIESIIEAEEE